MCPHLCLTRVHTFSFGWGDRAEARSIVRLAFALLKYLVFLFIFFSNHFLMKEYVTKSNRPPFIPISRILDGGDNPEFEAAFDAK